MIYKSKKTQKFTNKNTKNNTKKIDLKTYCYNSEIFNKQPKDIKTFYKIFKQFSHVANHTLIKIPNKIPDTCTDINIWKYEIYRNGKLITSNKPITTSTKYKKNKELPFLISCSFFGSNNKYVKGVFKMIKSLELHGLFKKWDIRLYIASRIDGKTVNLSTSKEIQKQLLEKGVELAHVDNNNPNGYSLEGTFWRFNALSEKARILIRDVDYIFTAHDLISLAEWIESKLIWHRTFNYKLKIAPFCAGSIGAIGNPNLIKDLHYKLENFPYKKKYGDDEMAALNILFMEALKSDNICTHYYSFFINIKPNNDSIFFPTNKYINKIIGIPIQQQNSIDIKLPIYNNTEDYGDPINFDFNEKHINNNKKFLSLAYFGERGVKCADILNIGDNAFHINKNYIYKN